MIRARKLVKTFGDIQAVRDISFTVEEGEILGFLGPNGAGKSTTMKMITGFLPPTSGTASIGQYDILQHPTQAKSLLGYLPESGPLYQEMTVTEFLHFIAEIRGLNSTQAKSALHRVIDICHLEGVYNQTIDTLSKGYRQRVGLAQAVLHDPACLILDEPTDGLDPNQKQEVRKLIADMAEKKSIILSTHILEEVEAMCTRVIIIDRGKIVVDDTPANLQRRHPLCHVMEIRVAGMSTADLANALQTIPSTQKVEEKGDSTVWLYPQNKKDLASDVWSLAQEKKWNVERIQFMDTPLDEVFRDLTASTKA